MIERAHLAHVRRADAVTRAGTELLRSTALLEALAEFGQVRPTGSFFADLAVRPEMDLLLLTRTTVTVAIRQSIAQRLREVTDAETIEHAVLPVAGSPLPKYFVRAHTRPRRSADSEYEWTIDTAVWRDIDWSARYGAPRLHPGRAPLDPHQRALVVALKAELLDSGRRELWTTTDLCNAVLDGHITSVADLGRWSVAARNAPR